MFLLPFVCRLIVGVFWLISAAKAIDSVARDSADYGLHDNTPYQTYVSEPDLRPSELLVTTARDGMANGYVFIGIDGHASSGQRTPCIYDLSDSQRMGSLVWEGIDYNFTFDFRTQTYKGNPVLTFWQGIMLDGYGHGSYYILNQSYAEIAHFSPVGVEEGGDLHEFYITKNDTALITVYVLRQMDLSSIGGPTDGWVLDGHFQEVDIETNTLIFSWNAADHVAVNETYNNLASTGNYTSSPFDYFHINSVQKDADGNYLVSSRVMSAVYKINGTDGSIIWRLNGRMSDFTVEYFANFTFQHNARWVDMLQQTQMTVFDNGDKGRGYSRGLIVNVDQYTMTVSLAREFYNTDRTWAKYEGNLELVDPNNSSSNWFLGFGNQPYFTEFTNNGILVLDVQWAVNNEVNSYRSYKLPWIGKPLTRPKISFNTASMKVYVSWNGATEVETWHIYTTDQVNSSDWTHVASKKRSGFETVLDLSGKFLQKYVRCKAVDGSAAKLSWSDATDGTRSYACSYDGDGVNRSTISIPSSTSTRPTTSTSMSMSMSTSTSTSTRIGTETAVAQSPQTSTAEAMPSQGFRISLDLAWLMFASIIFCGVLVM